MNLFRTILAGALAGSVCFSQTACVTLFGAGSQKVALKTQNSKADIYFGTMKLGQGSATLDAQKNQKAIEVIVKGDSLKDRRSVVMLEKKSGLYNANIPLWFLAILPGYWAHGVDRNCPKGWFFPQAKDIPAPVRKPVRLPFQQYIDIDDVTSMVKDGDVMTQVFRYKNGELKPGGVPGIIPTKYTADITYDDEYFKYDLYNTLKDYDYIDTVKRSIFWNKGLTLKAALKKRSFEGILPIFDVPEALRFGPRPGEHTTAIQYSYNGHPTSTIPVHDKIAIVAQMVVSWELYDEYDSKVFSDSTVSKSDPILLRSMDFTAKSDVKQMWETYDIATQDALAYALAQLQANPRFQYAMHNELAEKDAREKFAKMDVIRISKPGMDATAKPKLTDYLKSGVTIKLKQGHGSGFFVSQDGYIVTNYHVVADQDEKDMDIILSDDSKVKATIVRTNRLTDLALLKADVRDRSVLLLNQDNTDIGVEVWAIGTPKSLELGQTLSRGIISGLRKVDDRSYLQTDIALNPGNSGGAVITQDGVVQGVVSAGFVDQEGLNFAIPSRLVLESLKLSYLPDVPTAKNTPAPAPATEKAVPASAPKKPAKLKK